jgi:hypothetical protein
MYEALAGEAETGGREASACQRLDMIVKLLKHYSCERAVDGFFEEDSGDARGKSESASSKASNHIPPHVLL